MTSERQAILERKLREIAREGRVMPSNHTLRAELRWGGSTVAELLGRLERRKVVSIERVGRERVVRFLDTGDSTALPVNAENVPLRAVDRDPCARCAVRRDRHDTMGCGAFVAQRLSSRVPL